jgi:CelD/BcsL family acetyltransferase involved in cellulose biosynthesis
MNVAVRHPSAPSEGDAAPLPCAAEVASIRIFEHLAAAEPFWRRIEAGHPLASAYQRFDFLAAWQRHVGTQSGVTPFIVVGCDPGGEPAFLWPFGRTRVGPIEVAQFLGSKHANFNLGLWRRDLAEAITARGLREILDRVARSEPRADLLALYSQPFGWNGIANPFALLSHQSSVDHSMRLAIDRPGEATIKKVLSSATRSRLRGKQRKLEALPGFRYFRADTPADIDRLLDTFLAAKSIHMAQQGLTNVFAVPGVAEFMRSACHCRLPDGRHVIDIHALEADGEMLAMFAVAADEYRCSSMFNTYTLGEHSRHSPGLILLRHMVVDSADRGLRAFDLGVGKADYKSIFCDEVEPLFDSFIGLTAIGKLAVPALSAATSAKRLIKEKPSLWAAVQTLRRLRARRQSIDSQAAT